MNIKNSLICILTCYMILGCAGPYTEKDNGTTIALSEDDGFQITLMGEAQSDFTWRLVSENESIKLEFPPSVKTIGKDIEYTFNFKTFGDGEDIVALEYTDGMAVKKSFRIKVIVGTIGFITSE